MSWEKRRDTKSRYLYRSVRKNGKVVKQYIGRENDPVARLIDKKLRLDRAEKAAAAQELQNELYNFQQYVTAFDALRQKVGSVLRVCLWAEGVEYQEGQWVRMFKNHESAPEVEVVASFELPTNEEFQRLVRRASRGDSEAAEELQRIVRECEEIWGPYADLNGHVEATLVGMIAGDNVVLREALRTKMGELKDSLRGKTDNPVDGLLVDQIMILWLDSRYTHMAMLQSPNHDRDPRFWEDRFDRSYSRYHDAIRELVEIREIRGDIDGDSWLRDVVKGTAE